MNWLAQNWVWIAIGVGFLFLMTRMGGMGGCGMGHSSSSRHSHEGGNDTAPPAAGNRPGNLFDPVSGHTFVPAATPLSAVYRGRAYYFETRENRDAFEANSEQYAAAAPGAGQAIGAEDAYHERPRRRGGC